MMRLTALRWNRFRSSPTPIADRDCRSWLGVPTLSVGRAPATNAPTTLIVVDRHEPGHLTIRSKSLGTELIATVLAGRLDRRLAAGLPPEAGVLLATRAQRLNSPARCQQLAERWQSLLASTWRPPRPRSASVPVCRRHIAEAEAEIRSMIAVLTAPGPKSVCGTAMAGLLLSDGLGPVFNSRSPIDLGEALREAVRQIESLRSPGWRPRAG